MQYMARVEIHRADRETYERLHSAMEAESFTRTLTAESDGKKYQMPIGAYWVETSKDAWAVLEAAKRAALPIDPGAEIVISGGPQLVFFNCPKRDVVSPIASLLRLATVPSNTLGINGYLTGLAPAQPAKAPDLFSSILGTPYKRGY
jgi:hypothetical protein